MEGGVMARREEPRVGVYICHCGINISYKVDIEEVVEFASRLEHVVVARDYKFMCSNIGQELIINDIKEHNLNRVVVASCSPRMHEKTFRNACKKAGLNPYLFQMASIRELVSWVTEDEEEATQKAKDFVKAAVRRVVYHEPLQPRIVDINPNVLIIGGGIAGMQAALEIADAGRTVYLVEREPSIGGHMAKFDKTFPTLDCSACILTPKMVSVGQHENIKLLTYSEVEEVSGYIGNFDVKIRRKPRYVLEDKCTGCGECVKGCPVSVPNDFEYGMMDRTAIYRSFPQAVPNVFVIDKEGFSPCRNACPAGLNAHGYVKLISAGKYEEAFKLIMERVIFPASLGRACPAFCERECTRGLAGGPVQIRALKRFVADWYYENVGLEPPVKAGEKKEDKPVAVVGAGPAGLACAYYLAIQGYPVTVFEALEKPGGMLRYAIPEYRLPNDLVDKEIEFIRKAGVEIVCNTPVGKGGKRIDDLFQEGYKAVFLGIGAHKDRTMGIPGEDLEGVYHSITFLRRVNSGEKVTLGDKVIVVGGGNSAIDAARVALRLGAKDVTIVYRRSRVEMPAFPEEIEAAEAEGVKIQILTNPVAFHGKDGKLSEVECIRMELGEPDESGRRRPVPVEGTNFRIPADSVILAIGQYPDSAPLAEEGLEINRDGTIWVDPETLATSREGVFAGGDATKGPSTIVEAIGLGRQAAEYIRRFLEGEDLKARPYEEHWLETVDKEEVLKKRRFQVNAPHVPPQRSVEERIRDFGEVELPLDEERAVDEGKRCLDCAGCCECRQCELLCEPNAIDHFMKEETLEVKVGTIIVATGFKPFDPTRLVQYGYKRYPEVYTSLEFERLNNAAGPTGGEIRMKDGRVPERVAIIHCVGSRDENTNRYCSRVCCMYSMKFAHLVREKTGAEVYEFYIDIRSPGKMYEEFYNRLQEEGTHFIRGKVAEVTDVPQSPEEEGRLIVVAEDTLAGKQRRVPVDMVILSVGLEAAKGAEEVAHLVGISQDQDGWFIELHPKLAPVSTASDGVFIAGCCQGPKDIPDTVSQASGAAAEALSLIMRGQVEVEAATSYIDPEICVGCQQCKKICMYSAIDYDSARGVCVVNEAVCKGCGLCAATCPNKAVTVKHFNNQEIFSELEGVLF